MPGPWGGRRPRILVSNDDGVMAPGLAALAEALAALADLYIVAPDQDRSGTGHAITVREPLEVFPVTVAGRFPAYAVGGTPADCVKLGVLALFDERPDLVVAGINPGSNLGIDVVYSGTVSAAAEGALLGVPSVAISAVTDKRMPRFEAAREVARELVTWVLEVGLPAGTLLNVNVPEEVDRPVDRLTWTRLGLNRRYRDAYATNPGPDGTRQYWLTGDADDGDRHDPSTDAGAVFHGRVSVTPIHFDLTDYAALARWGAGPGLGWAPPKGLGAAGVRAG